MAIFDRASPRYCLGSPAGSANPEEVRYSKPALTRSWVAKVRGIRVVIELIGCGTVSISGSILHIDKVFAEGQALRPRVKDDPFHEIFSRHKSQSLQTAPDPPPLRSPDGPPRPPPRHSPSAGQRSRALRVTIPDLGYLKGFEPLSQRRSGTKGRSHSTKTWRADRRVGEKKRSGWSAPEIRSNRYKRICWCFGLVSLSCGA